MKVHRFRLIAKNTLKVFWRQTNAHITSDELTYLAKTPVVKRNLNRRIVKALADTLLAPEQHQRLLDTEEEDEQQLLKDLDS